jgi:hypothetical protein
MPAELSFHEGEATEFVELERLVKGQMWFVEVISYLHAATVSVSSLIKHRVVLKALPKGESTLASTLLTRLDRQSDMKPRGFGGGATTAVRALMRLGIKAVEQHNSASQRPLLNMLLEAFRPPTIMIVYRLLGPSIPCTRIDRDLAGFTEELAAVRTAHGNESTQALDQFTASCRVLDAIVGEGRSRLDHRDSGLPSGVVSWWSFRLDDVPLWRFVMARMDGRGQGHVGRFVANFLQTLQQTRAQQAPGPASPSVAPPGLESDGASPIGNGILCYPYLLKRDVPQSKSPHGSACLYERAPSPAGFLGAAGRAGSATMVPALQGVVDIQAAGNRLAVLFSSLGDRAVWTTAGRVSPMAEELIHRLTLTGPLLARVLRIITADILAVAEFLFEEPRAAAAGGGGAAAGGDGAETGGDGAETGAGGGGAAAGDGGEAGAGGGGAAAAVVGGSSLTPAQRFQHMGLVEVGGAIGIFDHRPPDWWRAALASVVRYCYRVGALGAGQLGGSNTWGAWFSVDHRGPVIRDSAVARWLIFAVADSVKAAGAPPSCEGPECAAELAGDDFVVLHRCGHITGTADAHPRCQPTEPSAKQSKGCSACSMMAQVRQPSS